MEDLTLRREILRGLAPPPAVPFSQWGEENFIVASEGAAQPGRFRCWPYQREPLDAMGDPDIERVTWIKSARIGYSTCLMVAIAATTALTPSSMILLVPTDDDAKGYARDEIEPAFTESPALQGLMVPNAGDMTLKYFLGGASLKILAAKSPRNLRRHGARCLFIDEEDAMMKTSEGDPIVLAEKRSLAFPDRKIIRGSTPTDEIRSTIESAYLQSDQRIFEVPCPKCREPFEILWKDIRWPKDEPEKAHAVCPHCSREIEERCKVQMVNEGGERGWTRTRPEVTGHAGFRSNTFISFFSNARWGRLAQEYLKALRAGPSELQAFANTTEGRVWKTSLDVVDETKLRNRVEDFGLETGEDGRNRFPKDCFLVLATVDTQDDRWEVGYFGFNESEIFFLGHEIVWGDPTDPETQAELDKKLKATWLHPNGWMIDVEAACIDTRGHRAQAVYDFCGPRLPRKIFPIISQAGVRPIWSQQSERREANKPRHWIIGHDEAKTTALHRLALPPVDKDGAPTAGRFRFSTDLPGETFDQLAAERRVVRYMNSRPVVEFRRTKDGRRNEALDLACYAIALRSVMRPNFLERRSRKGPQKPPPAAPSRRVIQSNY